MRILLTANASYVPPRGGSTRSNLVWLESLASRGHDCRVVAPAIPKDTAYRRERARADMEDQQIRVTRVRTDPQLGFDVLKRGDITVYSVKDPAKLRLVLRRKILRFQPDWVLVSSEDLGQALLSEAHQTAPGRVVYLGHTPQMFPFGPASLNLNRARRELVARSAAIVVIGNHTATYVEQHLGRKPVVIHPPVYGNGPFPRRDPKADGLITMINPCAVKGISIFLALAERFPQYRFGALRGWGTTEQDLKHLTSLPNVRMLPKVKRIAQVLMGTKLLLMPALWHEGFGLVVMEAMLRGVPVLASNMGSLVEAKAGTNYILPVRPIERYRTVFDQNRMPIPIIPEQDVEPWAAALDELMSDQDLYEKESGAARQAALRFVPTVKASRLEKFLVTLKPATTGHAGVAEEPGATADRKTIESLSPERRALLLRKIRERTDNTARRN